MSERVELGAALAWHPDGAVHLEHGVATLDAAGRAARSAGGGAVRWDYAATQMAAWCGCGWVGEAHAQRKATGAATGASRYDEWRRLHRSALQGMEVEWADHVHEVLPTLGIYEARVRLQAAEKALTDAVGDSRRRGASWADVGTATELGKKVAHARWGGGKDVLLPRQVSKGGRPRKARPTAAETTNGAADATGAGRTSSAGAQEGAGRRSGAGRGRDTGRRVRELVRVLSQRHGLSVEAHWQGTRSRDGRRGGWTLEWPGGPTRADMRADAALVVEDEPRLAGLDLGELTFEHPRLSDLDEAALVLEWLQTHPGEHPRIRLVDRSEYAGWPQNLPAELRVHAATLIAAGWSAHTSGVAADGLAHYATEGGYDAVAAWLTDIAADQKTAYDGQHGDQHEGR